MTTPAGLDHLLDSLRMAGLPVGVREVTRLHHVLQQLPDGVKDQDHLFSLLRAILVKSQAEREIFDRVCHSWLEQVTFDLEREQNKPQSFFFPSRFPASGKKRHRLPHPALLVILLLVLLFGIDFYFHEYFFSEPPAIQQVMENRLDRLEFEKSTESRKECPPPPAIVNPGDSPIPLVAPHIVLAIFGLMIVGRLWAKLRHHRWIPPQKPLPAVSGAPQRLMHTPEPDELLLSPEDREILVWGIGRFITGELSRRLDIAKTVQQTARSGGLPHIHFQQHRHHHEVWLWLDQAVDNPHLERLANELRDTLTAHGLTVELAWFHGIPDRLSTPEGQLFAPREIEEKRDAALVAILTDGRLLAMRHELAQGRLRLDALLRDLSHWPSLWFVDFSQGGHALATVLANHELPVLTPVTLAQRLGGVTPQPLRNNGKSGWQEHLWAATAALAPAPVDEGTLHALRQDLKLQVSPWSMANLRKQAAGPGHFLHWRGATRTALLNWLLECQEGATTLHQGVDFWLKRYEKLIASTTDQRARLRLQVEENFLKLWVDPASAILFLYQHCQGELAGVIKEYIFNLTFGNGSLQRIRMPKFSGLSGDRLRMLQEMTFNGGQFRVSLARSGRLWLGIWLVVGVSLGTLLPSYLRTTHVCQPTEEVDPKTGIVFMRLCLGSFIMGSNDKEWEKCPHKVTLTSFDMAKYEVTNQKYKLFKPDHTFKEEEQDWPVGNVSWNDANAFCSHFGYQLPTEAQWEYAARAGNPGKWSFGDDESLLKKYAWYDEGVKGTPHPVGQKQPNLWGLYDMHGNVWEWVADWYADYPYPPESDEKDPPGPPSGEYRSLRGGSFFSSAGYLRSADRSGDRPGDGGRFFGFRCVRSPFRQHGLTP